MTTQTLKVENGRITLPKNLQKNWQKAEVFVFPNKDTIVIKKIQKPLFRLSGLTSRISSPKMTQKEIEKEIQVYRKNK